MHVDVPITLVVIGTFCVLLAVLYVVRQLLVSRSLGSFECAVLRRGHVTRREGWQNGLMRFGIERLRWYRAFSLRVRPELTIDRREILDLERTEVDAVVEGMEPHVLIEMRMSTGRAHRLLVARSAAAGLLAWLEAAPAGFMRRGTD